MIKKNSLSLYVWRLCFLLVNPIICYRVLIDFSFSFVCILRRNHRREELIFVVHMIKLMNLDKVFLYVLFIVLFWCANTCTFKILNNINKTEHISIKKIFLLMYPGTYIFYYTRNTTHKRK